VEVAYNKNKQLVQKSSASVGKLLLQQQLWTKLQGTFFAPGADASAMSKQSALTVEERHACCPGCSAATPSQQLPALKPTTGSRRCCNTPTVLLQASSPKSSHPLTSSVTARSL
jgi:hypothetical protein